MKKDPNHITSPYTHSSIALTKGNVIAICNILESKSKNTNAYEETLHSIIFYSGLFILFK